MQMFCRFLSSYANRMTKINAERLMDTIHSTAKWGAHEKWGPRETDTGMCRLTLSDSDKSVRDWFQEQVKAIGCTVKVDEIGNLFAIMEGENEGLPLGMGSHLDTQPTGGRYDGILGVLAGLEVLRTIHDSGKKPKYPIALVDWCNEEGARFPYSVMGSNVWAGILPLEEAYQIKSVLEADGAESANVTVLDELKRIGYLGTTPASFKANPLYSHFELHIEQGPYLEDTNKKIGIVQGVQSYIWQKVTVKGKASHAGTTPFLSRSDALLAASSMIVKAIEIAKKHDGLATVGILTLEPASVNVIPQSVSFTLDIRHHQDEMIAQIKSEINAEFPILAAQAGGSSTKKPITVEFEHLQTSPAVHFAPQCIKAVTESAIETVGNEYVMEITSGAGHDSCATSIHCPTSMIFIPSLDGVSHNPSEYSTPEECATGAQVLLGAVLKLDSARTE